MPGVIRTRVGYAGGTTANPTYRDIGDHSEAIRVEYDPSRVSYEELLDVFWSSHNPTSRPWSRQYASILFYHGEDQEKRALEGKAREQQERESEVWTEVVPAGVFTLAEDYHQKYNLRNRSYAMDEFQAIYPDGRAFVDSTAAARVNGYLGGYGTSEQLDREWPDLGLSPEASEKLLQFVGASGR